MWGFWANRLPFLPMKHESIIHIYSNRLKYSTVLFVKKNRSPKCVFTFYDPILLQ